MSDFILGYEASGWQGIGAPRDAANDVLASSGPMVCAPNFAIRYL